MRGKIKKAGENNQELNMQPFKDVDNELFELREKLITLLEQGKSVIISGSGYFYNGLVASSFAEGYFDRYYFLLEDKPENSEQGKTWDSNHLKICLEKENSKLLNKETARKIILTNETMSLEELKSIKHQVIYFKFASEINKAKNSVEELIWE